MHELLFATIISCRKPSLSTLKVHKLCLTTFNTTNGQDPGPQLLLCLATQSQGRSCHPAASLGPIVLPYSHASLWFPSAVHLRPSSLQMPYLPISFITTLATTFVHRRHLYPIAPAVRLRASLTSLICGSTCQNRPDSTTCTHMCLRRWTNSELGHVKAAL